MGRALDPQKDSGNRPPSQKQVDECVSTIGGDFPLSRPVLWLESGKASQRAACRAGAQSPWQGGNLPKEEHTMRLGTIFPPTLHCFADKQQALQQLCNGVSKTLILEALLPSHPVLGFWIIRPSLGTMSRRWIANEMKIANIFSFCRRKLVKVMWPYCCRHFRNEDYKHGTGFT